MVQSNLAKGRHAVFVILRVGKCIISPPRALNRHIRRLIMQSALMRRYVRMDRTCSLMI